MVLQWISEKDRRCWVKDKDLYGNIPKNDKVIYPWLYFEK